MKKKSVLWICLIALLLSSMTMTITPVGGQTEEEVVVSVSWYGHQSFTTTVGSTFTAHVKIFNVPNLNSGLFGYEFRLFYDTALLDNRSAVLPEGHFLTPSDAANIYFLDKTSDAFNATHGIIWFSAVLLDVHAERPKNGSGVLATVTFEAKAEGGPSPLSLWYPTWKATFPNQSQIDVDYPVKLSTTPGYNPPWTGPYAIPCSGADCYVTVLPAGSPALSVTVTADPSSIDPGGNSTVTMQVTDDAGNPVEGANVTLSSDVGGTFSQERGTSNSEGKFTSIFKPPSEADVVTIYAAATYPNYVSGVGQTEINVAGAWELDWLLIALIVIVIVVVAVVAVIIVRRRRKPAPAEKIE